MIGSGVIFHSIQNNHMGITVGSSPPVTVEERARPVGVLGCWVILWPLNITNSVVVLYYDQLGKWMNYMEKGLKANTDKNWYFNIV